MKRIAVAFAALGMLTAGSFVMLSAGPIGAAKAAVVSRQAAGRYAAAARGPNASATRPDEQAPPPSIPYDADGPAYMPGQTRSTDFQLQH